MITVDDLISAARAELGTPFVHQGRLPGIALDCAGLLIVTAQKLGLPHIDVDAYGRLPCRGLLQEALSVQPALYAVPKSDMKAGDVLLMRFGAEPQHLALYTGETIIHSYEAVRMACEHALTEVWARRIQAIYRFNGVAK